MYGNNLDQLLKWGTALDDSSSHERLARVRQEIGGVSEAQWACIREELLDLLAYALECGRSSATLILQDLGRMGLTICEGFFQTCVNQRNSILDLLRIEYIEGREALEKRLNDN